MSSEITRHLSLAVAVGLVSAALFIYGFLIGEYWLRILSKPLPVLAMTAAVGALGDGDRYARTIMVGLGLCVFGDIFLEIGDATFLPGMIAFLLGHVAYIVAFVGRDRRLRPLEALPFLCWTGWAAATLWPHLGEMRIPVLAYTAVIFVMMWRASAVPSGRRQPTRWDWAVLVGAVLFGFSDTLIALDRFRAPIDGVRIPIIVTYWLGQLLIAASSFRRPSDDD